MQQQSVELIHHRESGQWQPLSESWYFLLRAAHAVYVVIIIDQGKDRDENIVPVREFLNGDYSQVVKTKVEKLIA